jgi:hypothetical protein
MLAPMRALPVALGIAAAAALWDTASHVVPTDAGSWRGISNPPSAARIAAAVVLGGIAAWRLRRASTYAAAPFAGLLVALLPLVPAYTGALLPLLAFQGLVLRLVAGAAVGVFLARLWAAKAAGADRVPLLALFAAAFAFYAAWGERFPGAGPQGDEPHYLVMAQSLLSDGDLDLGDEFASREYAAFYGGDLAPHTSPNSPRDRLHSMHSPGLPVLMLPAYAAGGYRGARLFVSALVALTAALLYRLVRETTGSAAAAVGIWTLAALAPPLPFFAVTLYPEAVASLAVVAFLLASRATPGGLAIAATAALAAVLPWVHTKYIPLAAAGLGFVLLRPVSWLARAVGAGAFAVSLVALAAYFRAHYGSASFTAALGPADVDPLRAPWGLAGALLDRQYGLLIVAPALAIGAAGLVALWRARTGDALRAIALALIVALPTAAYVAWWGGAAPPARHLVPLASPLLLGAAMVAARARDALAACAGAGLVLLGLAADTPRMLRNRPDGESLLLRTLSPDLDLNAWLPSFVVGDPRAAILGAALLATFAFAWRFGRRGLVAGVAAYAVAVAAVRDRPQVDRGPATQRLLWDWSDTSGVRTSSAGWRDLAVPFELPRAPWTLDAGAARNSRRIVVPPGAYHVVVRTRAVTLPAAARVEVFAGDFTLAALDVGGTGSATLPLLLPVGGRGIAVGATGAAGRLEIEDVRVVPETLAPPERRGELSWPERLELYRVGSDGVRVTALGRSPREGSAFRVRGEAAFVVEGPAAGAVEVRAPAGATVIAGGRELAAGEGAISLPFAAGVALGRTSALGVRVRAKDGAVSFALAGR